MGAVMVAELERDRRTGFWIARVQLPAERGGATGAGAVYVRHLLPVPQSATREQAETAFRSFLRSARFGGAGHER